MQSMLFDTGAATTAPPPLAEGELYTTPAYKIGKHYWRIIVFIHKYYGCCTTNKFSVSVAGPWKGQREWPRYNFNDSQLGLPRSLDKIYRRHQRDIDAALSLFSTVHA